MSILLVEVVPQGIIFGADRNITLSTVSYQQTVQGSQIIIEEIKGQSQRPKVLRWPQRKALIGYVGAAEVGGIPTDEWLYDFIGEHLSFANFEDLSESLRLKVERQRSLDEGNSAAEPLIIHLGGFEERDGVQVPSIWVIRNVWGYGASGYEDVRKEFEKRPAFWESFATMPPSGIQAHLQRMASEYNPFWFHQGFDLGTFNMIENFLKIAFKTLCQTSNEHPLPQTLLD